MVFSSLKLGRLGALCMPELVSDLITPDYLLTATLPLCICGYHRRLIVMLCTCPGDRQTERSGWLKCR